MVRLRQIYTTIFFSLSILTLSQGQSIIYVKHNATGANDGTTWANAYTDLQTGLDAASANDTIWVAAGTYYPTIEFNANGVGGSDVREKTFYINQNTIKIYGGFAGTETLFSQRNPTTNPTILSGDLGVPNDNTDNAYHIMFIDKLTTGGKMTSETVIDGFLITDGNADDDSGDGQNEYGAGIYMVASGSGNEVSPTISNCTFINHDASDGGGGIFITTMLSGVSNAVITNCTFSNNDTEDGGSGIYLKIDGGTANPVITNCTFSKNTADYGGAGLHFENNNSYEYATITNCTFDNNISTNGTGGFKNNSFSSGESAPILTNCTFTNNKGKDGGAIANTTNSFGEINIRIKASSFTNNTATGNGGAIAQHIVGYSIFSIIENSTFSANTSAGDGGAIYNETPNYSMEMLLTKNTFSANTATGRGGAIMNNVVASNYIDGRVIECRFTDNSAGYGGAVYTNDYSEFYYSTDTFSLNTATVSGGAIYNNGVNNEIIHHYNQCVFSDNNAILDAGAIYNFGRITESINNSDFTNNSAGGAGGALVNAVDGSVENRSIFAHCTFSANTAASIEGGGAVFNKTLNVASSNHPIFENCTFESNKATNHKGGAISNYSSNHGENKTTFTNCIFKSNQAADDGGAISRISWSQSTDSTFFTNCLFTKNHAVDTGGVFYLRSDKAGLSDALIHTSLINCTMAENTASTSNAIHSSTNGGTSNLIVKNAILWNNGTNSISFSGNGIAKIDTSIIDDGTIDGTIILPPNVTGTGNLDSNPLFINASGEDYALQISSPAKDKGKDAANPTDLDLAGNRRKIGRIDLGAYESCPLLAVSIIYVNHAATGTNDGTSWTNAFTRLQDAIDGNCGNADIWVANGIYHPTEKYFVGGATDTSRSKTFYVYKNMKIYGGFAGTETMLHQRNTTTNVTILSGDLGIPNDNSDNAYHVVFLDGKASEITTDMVIDGFTIRDGHAEGGKPSYYGGGIYNYARYGGVCSPTINDCQFIANTADDGGAIMNYGEYNGISSPIITNCSFIKNRGEDDGGAIYNDGDNGLSSPIISNCSFTNNYADYGGGAIATDGDESNSLPIITNCTFTSNYADSDGGAIYNDADDGTLKPIISHCTFTQNRARNNGGAIANEGDDGIISPIIINCVFSKDSSDYEGGALSTDADYSNYQVINCVFTDNYAMYEGGAIANETGSSQNQPTFTNCTFYNNKANMDADLLLNEGFPTFSNCIFWATSTNTFENANDGNITIEHSIFDDGTIDGMISLPNYVTSRNISDAYPLFVDTANRNLRLQYCSPAIDAGNSTTWAATGLTVDLDSLERPKDNGVDMGAYEGSKNRKYYVRTTGNDGNDGLSWATAFATVQAAIDAAVCGNDTIWVAGGTYYPTKDKLGNTSPTNHRTKTIYIPKDLSLYGGFAGTETALNQRNIAINETILSGDLGIVGDSLDNAYHVVWIDGKTPNGDITHAMRMDGFTIQDGLSNGGLPNGAGLYNDGGGHGNACSPTITNCVFRNNVAAFRGSAIFNEGSFNGKTATIISNCVFTGNDADAGGSVASEGKNEGLAIPTLINCLFTANKGRASGVYGYGHVGTHVSTIINCTFVKNTPIGLGIIMTDGLGTTNTNISNSIFWDNGANSLFAHAGSITIQHSIYDDGVENGTINLPPNVTGGNNSDANPKFIDENDADGADNQYRTTDDGLRLTPCSPAIDIGDNASWMTTNFTKDIIGNPRPYNGTVDAGTYEFQSSPVSITINTPIVTQPLCKDSMGIIVVDAVSTGALEYSIDNGATWQIANTFGGLAAGDYAIKVRLLGFTNCEETYTNNPISIVEPTAVTATAMVDLAITCSGAMDGTATVTGTGGAGTPYTYLWDANHQTTATATDLAAGTYNVTVTDANGCADTAQVTLTDPTPIDLSLATTTDFNGYSVSCHGGNNGEITAIASGGTGALTYSKDGMIFQSSTVFTGLSAGKTIITAKDANGCISIDSVLLNEPTVLTASATILSNYSSAAISCNGASDGIIAINRQGGIGNVTYSSDNITYQNSNVFSGLGAGLHTFYVKDANDCVAMTTITLVEPIPITATAMVTSDYNDAPISCHNANNGQVTITALGGTSLLTYSLDGNNFQTSSVFDHLSAGTYTIRVKDNNGCMATLTPLTITAPTEILATAMVTSDYNGTDISSAGATDGEITVTATGGTNALTYSLDGLTYQNGNVFQNLGAGIYTVYVKDGNDCIKTISITISDVQNLEVTIHSIQEVTCFGGNDGAINLTVNGGVAPYTYLWSNGDTTEDINGLEATIYTVTVTDANGTLAVADTTISEPTAISVNLTSTNPTCHNGQDGQIVVAATGGTNPINYSINEIDFQNSTTFDNLIAATYMITAMDGNGCLATDSITLSEPTAIIVSAMITTPISCNNGTNGIITVNATGGTGALAYQLNNGTYQNNSVFDNLGAGNHTISVKDANNCIATTMVTLTEPNELAVTVDKSAFISCHGESDGELTADAIGGTSPYQYKINGGTPQNTPVFAGLGAGNYTIEVIDINGCTANSTIHTFTEPDSIIIDATIISDYNGSQISCVTATDGIVLVTASGGTGNLRYSIDGTTFQTNPHFTGLGAGTYTFTVKDENNCTATTTATIIAPSTITGTIAVTSSYNGADISCAGAADGEITVTASNGTGTLQYSLNGNFPQTSNVFNNLDTGVYSVTIVDTNGCSMTTNTVRLSEPIPITGSATITKSVSCHNGMNGKVEITATGGTGALTYRLSGTNFQTNNLFEGLNAGTYEGYVRDTNGCLIQTNNVFLTNPSPITAIVSIDTTYNGFEVSCDSATDGRISIAAQGGSMLSKLYSLDGVNYQTDSVFMGLGTGNYTVFVVNSDNCGDTIQNILLNAPMPLNATITLVESIECHGESNGEIQVSSTGGTLNHTYSLDGVHFQSTGQFLGLAAANYTVMVKDENDCSTTASINIDEPTALSFSAIIENVQCFNGNDGSIIVTVTGGTGFYTYSLDDINYHNANIFDNLTAGTYTVFVKDENGCKIAETITITAPIELTIDTVIATDVACFGGNDGHLSITATGGTGNLQYSLDNISYQNSNTFSNLNADEYTVWVKDANGCMTMLDEIQIDEPNAMSIDFSITSAISCNGQTDGEIEAMVLGGIPIAIGTPYTYQWNDGFIVPNRTNLSAGTYSLTVTDANGCIITDSMTLAEPDTLHLSVFESDPISCFGENDGAIGTAYHGGTSPYSFLWTDGSSTNAIANLVAGTYSVTMTDANGCQATAMETLNEPSALVVAIASTTNVTCHSGADGAIDLTVTGGTGNYTYNWSNELIAKNPTGLSAGTYTVTVTDANGCEAFAQATISAPTALGAAFVTTDVSCHGLADGTATIIAIGGITSTGSYTYAWSDGQITSTATGLSAGAYSFTVTDANGCTTDNTVTIAEPTALTATFVTTDVSCYGLADGTAAITATGGITSTGTYTYAWSDGQTTSTATGLSAGTYGFTVTDANGCTTDNIVTIAAPTDLVANTTITQAILCNGGKGSIEATALGGIPITIGTPYTYAWNTGATLGTLTNLSAGTYSVTVTDANGCSRVSTTTLIEPTTMIATFSSSAVSCQGAGDGEINLTVTGGTGNYTYNWSNNETTKDLINLSGGTYTVTITDGNGCTATTSATITEPNALTVIPTATNVSCHGAKDGLVTLVANGGTAPYTYLWDNNTTNSILQNIGGGTYQVTVTDANGCMATTVVTITEPTAIVVTSTTTNVLCHGNQTGVINLTVSGGEGNYTYDWGNGITTANRTNLGAGTYTVVITDENGCQTTHVANITEPDALITTGTIGHLTCFGGNDGSLSITTTGGTAPFHYTWSDATIGNTPTPNGLAAGIYTVTVTDANGCMVASTLQVTEPLPLAITATILQPISCNGGTGSLATVGTGGTAPYTIVVTDSNGNLVTNPNNVMAGTYTATITDVNGCSAGTQITLTEPTALVAQQIIVNDVECAGGATGSISLNFSGGTGAYLYNWGGTNNGTGNMANNLTAGNYSVTITDFNGCTITSNFTVNEPAPLTVTLATADDPTDNTVATATATVLGGTTPYTYQWDGGTGSQTTATATGLSTGLYTVTIIDDNGCVVVESITVQPTSITDIKVMAKTEIFPNPTTGQATIRVQLSEASDIQIAIYTITGVKIRDFGTSYTDRQTQQIDLSEMTAGVYLVRFVIGKEVFARRLVVVRE